MSHHPLIIVGMHRSGTSMLTRILRHQGVFLGHRIQGDDEALFFLKLNRWMLHMGGTEWDNPAPALHMVKDPANIERLLPVLRSRLGSVHSVEFLGPRYFEAGREIRPELPFHWGFKDPRTSLFLPVWDRIFPQARILRIQRHGIDVARSLQKRHLELVKNHSGSYQKLARLGVQLPKRQRVVDAVRVAEISGGVTLWDEYESAIDRSLAEFAPERQMAIRYEDYLTDPADHHRRIAEFLDFSIEKPLPDGIRPDPSRAYAYRSKPELQAAAEELAPVLSRHNY